VLGPWALEWLTVEALSAHDVKCFNGNSDLNSAACAFSTTVWPVLVTERG
jgi:hypothetical protein